MTMRVIFGLILVALTGCATLTKPLSMSLEQAELEQMATELAASAAKTLDTSAKGGNRPVVAIGRIRNDTICGCSVDIVGESIEQVFAKSGKADALSMKAGRLPEGGSSPTYTLSGKLVQVDRAKSSDELMVEYLLSLTITDIVTGLPVWSSRKSVVKVGPRSAVTW